MTGRSCSFTMRLTPAGPRTASIPRIFNPSICRVEGLHMRNITRQPNNLLAALSESDRRQLMPHLTQVELRSGAVLAEPYAPLKHAYFLYDSMVSLVSMTSEGTSVEVAMVGKEGLI